MEGRRTRGGQQGEVGAAPAARRGRHPLPDETRGETLSCYIPRWAVERLQSLADGEQLSRNMLVRRILLDYLVAAGESSEDGRPTGRHLVEAQR